MQPTHKTTLRWIAGVTLAFLLIPSASADVWDKKTDVTFREPVEFPGGTILAPGHYVMKLLDSSSNRNIVQVYSQNRNRLFVTVLAIPAARSEPADKTIITFYETPRDSPAFIHKWFYPGDTAGQEFPYPKDRVNRLPSALSNVSRPEIVTANPISAPSERLRPVLLDQGADPAGVSSPEVSQKGGQPDVNRDPADEPGLLAQATPQQGPPQTPRATAVEGDATAPAGQLPATASNAPLWAAGSLVLLASAFSLRTLRRMRG